MGAWAGMKESVLHMSEIQVWPDAKTPQVVAASLRISSKAAFFYFFSFKLLNNTCQDTSYWVI